MVEQNRIDETGSKHKCYDTFLIARFVTPVDCSSNII